MLCGCHDYVESEERISRVVTRDVIVTLPNCKSSHCFFPANNVNERKVLLGKFV